MKQWKNTKLNNYKIDSRSEADILEQIRELAASYVPEWKFDEKDPDIGSVISMIYARHMMDNLDKYNDILEQYHIDFVNMLGISLCPAIPASSMVVMELSEDTIAGMPVSKGVKLLTDGDNDKERVVFETGNSLYVTNSKLVSMFMTSSKTGKLMPLLGSFQEPNYVDTKRLSADTDEGEAGYNEFPFGLFDFQGKGIEKNAVLLYHSHLFDVEDSAIYIRFDKGESIVEGIQTGAYRLSYYTKDGFVPFSSIQFPEPDMLAVYKSEPCEKVTKEGLEYSLILLEARDNPQESVTVDNVWLSSTGEGKKPEFVTTGNNDLNVEEFQPFGDTLSLYKEFYIGEDEYFNKPGAFITIDFQVNYEVTEVTLTRQEEDEELKIIKRKPRMIYTDAVADTYAEEIAIEYYNGNGWKRLECQKPYKKLFASGMDDRYTLQFFCPEDWQETSAGADTGRCLRIQLLKADNCYLRPCMHHYPVITKMQISYTYENHFSQPERLDGIFGTKVRQLTTGLFENRGATLFMKSEYDDTALYLGFDKKMEDGPISLLFQLEEENNFQETKLDYYYSTAKGFVRMKLMDYTKGMTNSERIVFLPPSDMHPMTLEGHTCYWIKAVDTEAKLEEKNVFRPYISNIFMNAVEVTNEENLPEEEYYVDEIKPNMTFQLYATNVLSVRVWVNENNTLTDSTKRRMLAEHPEEVRAEYDMQGNIVRFFVHWQEVDNFDCSDNGDRHFCVDRMNNTIQFGDGVHAQIPRNTQDVAFLVQMTRCSGTAGNLEPETINSSMKNLMFINKIYNPLKSYGGSDIETLENALKRGGNLISSRHRLVSVMDYEREILSYSDNICQVKTVLGLMKDGTWDDQAISFIILLEDYLDNPQTFYHMQGAMKEHLLTQSELSIHPDKLLLVAPLFVTISVEIWVEISNMEEAFEVQNRIREVLDEYLNPYSGEGWEIGTLPKETQLRLLIQSVKRKAVVRHMMVVAGYQDGQGYHEQVLKELDASPYMLCKSGSHQIHLIQK